MFNDKFQNILNVMIERGIVPREGQFLITNEMLESSIQINGELQKSSKNLQPSDRRYHRKLTGLNLLKLNELRSDNVEVKKKSKIKQNCGMLYIISNPAFEKFKKIGITQNLNKRLDVYQTYDPFRRFEVEKVVFIQRVREAEKFVINKYQMNMAKGEWVPDIEIKSLFKEIEIIGNSY